MQLVAQLDNFDNRQLESDINCSDDPGKTQQHFKDEVDINTIVERFGLTGELPQVVQVPQYADYEGIFDFQTAMNAVRHAQEGFMELPAKLRARFDNDPQKLLTFLGDEENREEAIKLGLVNKPQEQVVEETPQPTKQPTP